MDQRIDSLTATEQAWLADQLEAARRFVEGVEPVGDGAVPSLEALDQAWTDWVAAGERDHRRVNETILAVGVAFGQRLADGGVLRWVIATDEGGSDIAVYGLPGCGDVLVYPTGFVAKRYERGETGFLVRAFAEITAQVEAVRQAHAGHAARRPWWRRR